MSTFGAVDLTSLSSGAPGSASGGQEPDGGAALVPGPLVVDVSAQNLQEVAERSLNVPVVIVLHTTRSQPSQDLAALLARLAAELQGRFELARVDVDAAPEVAQALQASAVPSVMALVAGQPVPVFQGTADETQVRQVLDQLLQLAAANGVTGRVAVGEQADEPQEPEETETERAAREAIEAGDYAAAEQIYDHAIAQSPADDTLKVARAQVRMLARMDGQDPQALLARADAPGADLDAVLAGAAK